LDEAFGFAISARSVGTGKEVAQAVALTSGAEEMRTVAGAVVAHDPLRFDAQRGEISQSAFQEEDGAVLTFIGHDLSKSQPGSVIDADMDKFPAGAAHLIASIVGDAVTGPYDPAQLLDIEVEQFARELALVAHDRRSGLKVAPAREPMTAQEPRDRGPGESALARDLEARQTQPAQSQDHGHLREWSLSWKTMGPRRTIA
jgi:hypothetical protein